MAKDMRVDQARVNAQGSKVIVGPDKWWDVGYGDYVLDRSKGNNEGTLMYKGQPIDPRMVDPAVLQHITGSLKEHKGALDKLGFVGDVIKFEQSNLGTMLGNAKKNPLGLLLGGADAVGNKLWQGLGVDVGKPLVNEWGGATEQAYRDAAAKGIDIGPGAMMHQIAQTVAGSMAGGYGLSKLGTLFPALSGGVGGQVAQAGLSQLTGRLAPGMGGYNWGSILGGAVGAMDNPTGGAGQAPGGPGMFAPFSGIQAPQIKPAAASAALPPNMFEAMRQRLRTGQGDYVSPNYTPGALSSTPFKAS